MKTRMLATWSVGLALAVTGVATLTRAQQPQQPAPGADRAKLRAQVIKIRTEVEMLAFDYDLERTGLMDDMKTRKSFEMLGGLMSVGNALQTAIHEQSNPQPAAPRPRPVPEADAKQAAEEAKKSAAEEAEFLAGRKKELARRASALAERRLDLEDLERTYRESGR